MSRTRLVVLLASALVVMLGVVVLRAETTKLNFEISQIERQSENLRIEYREKELELARYRDPAQIRERLARLRIEGDSTPKPPPTTRRSRG